MFDEQLLLLLLLLSLLVARLWVSCLVARIAVWVSTISRWIAFNFTLKDFAVFWAFSCFSCSFSISLTTFPLRPLRWVGGATGSGLLETPSGWKSEGSLNHARNDATPHSLKFTRRLSEWNELVNPSDIPFSPDICWACFSRSLIRRSIFMSLNLVPCFGGKFPEMFGRLEEIGGNYYQAKGLSDARAAICKNSVEDCFSQRDWSSSLAIYKLILSILAWILSACRRWLSNNPGIDGEQSFEDLSFRRVRVDRADVIMRRTLITHGSHAAHTHKALHVLSVIGCSS